MSRQDIVEPRIVNYRDLMAKYGLEVVAGSWLYMPYSGYATHAMVCRISRCTGEMWPLPLPGINDLPECLPRQDIVDVSAFGPSRGKEAHYNKYVSEYSPDGLLHLVKVSKVPVLQSPDLLSPGHLPCSVHGKGKTLHSHRGSVRGGARQCEQSGRNSGWHSGRCLLQLLEQVRSRASFL